MRYPSRRQYKHAKTPYRVLNWREYEAGLRQRGDLTLWLLLRGRAAGRCEHSRLSRLPARAHRAAGGQQGVAVTAPPRVLFIWPEVVTGECVVASAEFLYKQLGVDGRLLVYTTTVSFEEILDTRITSEELRAEVAAPLVDRHGNVDARCQAEARPDHALFEAIALKGTRGAPPSRRG